MSSAPAPTAPRGVVKPLLTRAHPGFTAVTASVQNQRSYMGRVFKRGVSRKDAKNSKQLFLSFIKTLRPNKTIQYLNQFELNEVWTVLVPFLDQIKGSWKAMMENDAAKLDSVKCQMHALIIQHLPQLRAGHCPFEIITPAKPAAAPKAAAAAGVGVPAPMPVAAPAAPAAAPAAALATAPAAAPPAVSPLAKGPFNPFTASSSRLPTSHHDDDMDFEDAETIDGSEHSDDEFREIDDDSDAELEPFPSRNFSFGAGVGATASPLHSHAFAPTLPLQRSSTVLPTGFTRHDLSLPGPPAPPAQPVSAHAEAAITLASIPTLLPQVEFLPLSPSGSSAAELAQEGMPAPRSATAPASPQFRTALPFVMTERSHANRSLHRDLMESEKHGVLPDAVWASHIPGIAGPIASMTPYHTGVGSVGLGAGAGAGASAGAGAGVGVATPAPRHALPASLHLPCDQAFPTESPPPSLQPMVGLI